MYRWELDGPAAQEFAGLKPDVRVLLSAFMDAVVIVDPVQYQHHSDERDDIPMPLRTLHFGSHHEGLVTFLIYRPDDLVLVVRIQWLGDLQSRCHTQRRRRRAERAARPAAVNPTAASAAAVARRA